MKLFVIIREKGELSNFYTGLVTCDITWERDQVKILGVLRYSQYDRIGRYTAKEPEKFKTIKEYVYQLFDNQILTDQGKNDFIDRIMNITNCCQMWVHNKSKLYG